jgi:hypothetical protein
MKLFKKMKDGGPESTVTGYWLIESKKFFSIVLLKFEGKSREAYHNHAFNARSWVLPFGMGLMECLPSGEAKFLKPDSYVYTPRERMHKVDSNGTNWILSFRGPWSKTWNEVVDNQVITLTSGRKKVS